MTDTARKPARINWTNLLTVGSASVLVGAMILALGFATGWAVAGALGLGEIGTRIIEAVFVGVAIVGVVSFWRSATRVEPVIER
jgi:cation transporter-like permease